MNFFRRLTEPSSHAGLAALAQVLSVFAPQWAAVLNAATVLFGALAVAIPEQTPEP